MTNPSIEPLVPLKPLGPCGPDYYLLDLFVCLEQDMRKVFLFIKNNIYQFYKLSSYVQNMLKLLLKLFYNCTC
jgi:hypothetical protein